MIGGTSTPDAHFSALKAAAALAALLAVLALAGLVLSTPVRAGTYAPKNGKVFHGISDTGDLDDLKSFFKATRAHSAVVQGFESWGRNHDALYRHWRKTRTRGQMSISTAPGYGLPGVKTTKEIALSEGDAYILRLNRDLAKWGDPVYIRLMAEMNGHWNDYSAFNQDGSARPGRSTRWYRKAWQRFTIIIRGGWVKKINKQLRRQKLPPVRRSGPYKESGLPAKLRTPKVAMQWVPQTQGSPNLRANMPKKYWPGGRYVDWVGIDTYSKYPAFRALGKFYKEWKRKPFVIGEYGVWDYDSPRFMKRLAKYVRKHNRIKLLTYYQDFGNPNPFRIQQYPRSRKVLRQTLNQKRYKPFAANSRRPGNSRLDD